MPPPSRQHPNEIYHRLYGYIKRNVDPFRIAAALNLPLKTVQNFIARFKAEKGFASTNPPSGPGIRQPISTEAMDFLDIFVFSKTRHSIVDISGSIDKKNAGKLKGMLLKTKSSNRNPIALKMTDVRHIDNIGAETVVSLYAEFKQMGRYFAILDPSSDIEPLLKQFGIDLKVPIFGTEIAFEEHAFH